MADASHRIDRETTSMDIETLCKRIKPALDNSIAASDNTLRIPEHQRHAGVWPLTRQKQLISSVRKNHPIPSILIGSVIGEHTMSLEDGLQRLSTFLKFYENQLTDAEGRYYNDYSATEQVEFRRYSVVVEKFSGADEQTRIEIFDNRQNGSPLTPGERLFAHSRTPLVSYTLRVLLTPGSELYDRCTNVWGMRGGDKDKKNRRTDLLKAVALVAGIAHGPEFLTKKYDVLRPLLTKPFNEELTTKALDRLLEIYEYAQINCKWKPQQREAQFDGGLFSCYIVYSMFHAALHPSLSTVLPAIRMAEDDEWDPIKEEWIRYMIDVRTRSNMNISLMKHVLKECLHQDVTKARSWTLARWEKGYLRVFDSENELLQSIEEDSDADSEYESTDNDDE